MRPLTVDVKVEVCPFGMGFGPTNVQVVGFRRLATGAFGPLRPATVSCRAICSIARAREPGSAVSRPRIMATQPARPCMYFSLSTLPRTKRGTSASLSSVSRSSASASAASTASYSSFAMRLIGGAFAATALGAAALGGVAFWTAAGRDGAAAFPCPNRADILGAATARVRARARMAARGAIRPNRDQIEGLGLPDVMAVSPDVLGRRVELRLICDVLGGADREGRTPPNCRR